MYPKKDDQNMQASGVQSIKADIESLAHQLWLRKRYATEGVDWLVDSRLMTELNELSRDQLLRVKRLLAKSIGKTRSNRKYMTAGPV